ncbi:MAG: TetR/AcrR family transcriptional regulator [Solirubrobacteraceae bacterium]|jgi:AcrR family transcriptional regulator|nr:TetR/AcrR family transcriptional regulator [Solirubrobacteraceae bacterium]
MEATLDRRRVRSTRALLDAAGRLFADHGFAGTTVEHIAREADVAVGTIYGNFGGKRELYLAAVERALDLNEEYVAPVYASGMSASEEVIASGAAYLRFYREHPAQFRLLAMPPLEPGESAGAAAAEAIHERVDRALARMAGSIERAVAEGTIRPVPPLPAARFLMAALNGTVALNLLPGVLRVEGKDLEDVVRVAFRIVGEGIAAASLRGPDAGLAPGTEALLDRLLAGDEREET